MPGKANMQSLLSPSTKRNIRLRYAISALESSIFTTPIWIISGLQYFHFGYTQILAMSFVSYFSNALLQVPTGVLADRWGRRRALILGNLVAIASSIPFLVTKDFTLLMLSRPLSGLGMALTDGPLSAIVYDDLQRDNQDERFPQIAAHANMVTLIARGLSALTGGYMYEVDPRLPFLGNLLAEVGMLALSLAIRDRPLIQAKSAQVEHSHRVRDTISLLKQRHLAVLIAILVGFSVAAEFLWYDYQPYFTDIGLPIHVIGFCYVALCFLCASGSKVIGWMTTRVAPMTIARMILLFAVSACICMTIIHTVWGAIAQLTLSVVLGAPALLAEIFVNQNARSSYRVTALSAASGILTGLTVVADLALGLINDNMGFAAGPLFGLAIALFTLLASFLIRSDSRNRISTEAIASDSTVLDSA